MTTAVLKEPGLDEYFTALFEMYGTSGWQKILEDMARMAELLGDVRTCDSNDERLFRQGQLNVIDQILNHRERSETAYAHALSEQEGGVVEITLGGEAKVVAPDAPEFE
jgi:hypothetical protein